MRRPNKYRAVQTVVDGIKFPSKAEAARWCELQLLQRAKEISDLRRQVRIPLYVNGRLICTYVADFVYRDRQGREVIEDSKGIISREFRIKSKLHEAIFGQEIQITGKGAKAADSGWVTRRNLKQGAVG